MGASMPSAGVACALERDMLARLVDPAQMGPFDPGSLTEDYEIGLRIAARGGCGIFLRMRDSDGELVATREYFPDTMNDAVKQKARWMVGIALAGWDRMGWQGGPAEWWMRIRDRRATLSALILFMTYLALLLWAILKGVEMAGLAVQYQPSPTIDALLWLNLGLMAWRMGMRVVFVARSYGWRHGLSAIPRIFIANFIAMFAARRALYLYIKSLNGKPLMWDKTRHRFPDLEQPA